MGCSLHVDTVLNLPFLPMATCIITSVEKKPVKHGNSAHIMRVHESKAFLLALQPVLNTSKSINRINQYSLLKFLHLCLAVTRSTLTL